LRTVSKGLQRPLAIGNFIIAKDEGKARAELAGTFEGFTEFQFGGG